ncbi:MAG: flavodoxin-dependent (E)-4-hydroxy-3-methylbut-2-enyl-diphosphate synthase [Spirochaetaceae bacterium]|nr:flavodoxin-dependent (E)-4-hydroxy-3-methylbut-2-enyl-diphosphate synthase [Spirochaetaceae bacterium]
MYKRRATGQVKAGSLIIGSSSPITIQTMWDKPLDIIDTGLINRINGLKKLGCDIIRFAVPTMQAAEQLGLLADRLELAVVADIHFDYRIALKCLDYPIAKLRLNPGNIGGAKQVKEVARKALDKAIPIRIGVNGGSLEKRLASLPRVEALVASALEEANLLEQVGFKQIVVSIKDSNPNYVLEANRLLAKQCDYPLHLGITEAGPLIPSLTKSAFFLGTLLSEGIGDTIRISISDTPEREVMAGRELLSTLGLANQPKPKLISCPRCGRASFDVHGFSQKLEPILYTINKDITIAVMGCAVNGPGEAGHADLAISGIGDKVFVYKYGQKVYSGKAIEAESYFMQQLNELAAG